MPLLLIIILSSTVLTYRNVYKFIKSTYFRNTKCSMKVNMIIIIKITGNISSMNIF